MTVDSLLTLAIDFLSDLGVSSYLTSAVGAAVVLSLVAYVLHKFAGNAGGRG